MPILSMGRTILALRRSARDAQGECTADGPRNKLDPAG